MQYMWLCCILISSWAIICNIMYLPAKNVMQFVYLWFNFSLTLHIFSKCICNGIKTICFNKLQFIIQFFYNQSVYCIWNSDRFRGRRTLSRKKSSQIHHVPSTGQVRKPNLARCILDVARTVLFSGRSVPKVSPSSSSRQRNKFIP